MSVKITKSRSWVFSVCFLIALGFFMRASHADKCLIENRLCVLEELESQAAQIEQSSWRDQIYREIAKTYASDLKLDQAISFIDKIETPDTKAMTIRGIGMAAADHNLPKAEYDTLFTRLRTESEKITHPPSYAIALTYVAMAQAFANDDEGAWATAADMKNDALRHKAYGETAEIQAEKGKYAEAMKSIGFIESAAFRNKAYGHVSRILADHGYLQESYEAATNITNPYKKSQALQYVLDIQKPREVSHK